METLDLGEILTRARAVIRDGSLPSLQEEVCFGAQGAVPRSVDSAQRCYVCGGPNHLARDCLARHKDSPFGRGSRGVGRGMRRGSRCFRCGATGHIASGCQGNDRGEAALALASSPTEL